MIDEVEKANFGISPFWLRRYNITLNSEADTLIDSDNDGLTLKDEYLNQTDPFDADTDKDGYSDGEEVRFSYNPLGEGKLDKNKDGLPDLWEIEHGFSLSQNNAKGDPDNDTLPNDLELAYGTDPNNSDSDGDGYDDATEIANGYDPTVPGETRLIFEIFIKKINASAPIILSKNPSEEALLDDLKRGVILYPQSSIPGQAGNAVINGHSSNYAWTDGSYNYVFKDLNSLEKGDKIEISVSQRNGKGVSNRYAVIEKDIVGPDDPKIFISSEKKLLTLVTCWPPNTNLQRLIVRAELIQDSE